MPFIVLVCLVCAPFFLLSALIAFENRKRSLGGIIAGNILLIAAMFAISSPGVVNMAIALVAWLVMLHFSLRQLLRRESPAGLLQRQARGGLGVAGNRPKSLNSQYFQCKARLTVKDA